MKDLKFLFIFINLMIVFLIFFQQKNVKSSNFSEKFSQDNTNFKFIEILTTFLIFFNLTILTYNFILKI